MLRLPKVVSCVAKTLLKKRLAAHAELGQIPHSQIPSRAKEAEFGVRLKNVAETYVETPDIFLVRIGAKLEVFVSHVTSDLSKQQQKPYTTTELPHALNCGYR